MRERFGRRWELGQFSSGGLTGQSSPGGDRRPHSANVLAAPSSLSEPGTPRKNFRAHRRRIWTRWSMLRPAHGTAHRAACWRAVPGSKKPIGPHTVRDTFITAALGAGVPLRDVQEAASHADPRTTMRHDRARVSLDRHVTYLVATYVAGATRYHRCILARFRLARDRPNMNLSTASTVGLEKHA